MKKKLVAGTIVGLLALGGAPALAVSASSPDGGSYAYNVGQTFYVRDSKADSHGAYGYWNLLNNRLNNKSGYNTTVSKNTGWIIGFVKACTDLQLAPDTCSDWK